MLRLYEQGAERLVERFTACGHSPSGRPPHRLYCSRDRFGIKPFYYRWNGARFVFGSEPRAFRHDPQTRFEPNLVAVRDFLEQGYTDHRDESFFTGVLQLPPAHVLQVDANGVCLRRYWQLQPADPPDDPVGAFRERFVDSVRLRLRSDVPIGTALSGGLDSSAVAVVIDHLLRTEVEVARPVGERQATFTAFFAEQGYDERPYASAVTNRIRSLPHLLTFDDVELTEIVPAVVTAQGEPFGSTSVVAQWVVMRAARDAGLKVMLDGQGGDEILAGYVPLTWSYRFADLLAGGRLPALRREAQAAGFSLAAATRAAAAPFLPWHVRWRLRARRRRQDQLVHPQLRKRTLPASHRPETDFSDRLRAQYHAILARFGLPELLRYEDRNTMAHSLEGRVPFLDHRLVELAYSLPAEQLVVNGTTKTILRRAFADLLPDEVRTRRDKLGFVTPEHSFLRGALGGLARDVLNSDRARQRGFSDVDAVLRRLQSGENIGFEIWRALSVELWARAYLD